MMAVWPPPPAPPLACGSRIPVPEADSSPDGGAFPATCSLEAGVSTLPLPFRFPFPSPPRLLSSSSIVGGVVGKGTVGVATPPAVPPVVPFAIISAI